MRRRSLLLAFFFLALAAIGVVGYLFLLNVLSGKVDPFSAAIPAVFLALAALAINWRFLRPRVDLSRKWGSTGLFCGSVK